jgi:RecA-family ATPase
MSTLLARIDDDATAEGCDVPVPGLIRASDWLVESPPEVEAILEDVFGLKDKLCIIGGSKARKSFFVLQMACTLASGLGFLGWRVRKARRILLVQFEIKPEHFRWRVWRIARAIGTDAATIGENLYILNARGTEFAFDHIAAIAKKVRAEIIIFDPLFKILTGDENKACDVKPVLHAFDKLCESTGAAIIYTHHDSKGQAGDRDTRDRGAGSNVLGRDYDACVTLTSHKDAEDHVVLQTLLRNYAPQAAFTVRWSERGCFERADDVAAVVKTSFDRPSQYADAIAKLQQQEPNLPRREAARRLKCSLGTIQKHWSAAYD